MNIENFKNNLVISSNDLVHAKYDLTLWQKRVFVYAISQLQKDDVGFKPIKINASDIIRFFKCGDGIKAYKAILEAPKYLDKTIEIPYYTDKNFLRYGFVKLLQKYTIPADTQADNQYIELWFNNDLKPHLLELKEKFLKYDIKNIIELQSTYSFRMFEILKSYEFRKTIELEIDYLRKILSITTKYQSYKDFRIYIIDKAQEDLTNYCDITFTYEPKRGTKGKKIESIVFHILKNDAPQRDEKIEVTMEKREKSTDITNVLLFNKTVESEPKQETIEQKNENVANEKLTLELFPIVVSQFGVGLKVFMDLVETHTEGAIRQAIQVTEKAIQTGKVDSHAGFFVNALKNNYQDATLQKKKVEDDKMAEKKLKAATLQKIEADINEQKQQTARNESHRKMSILKNLVQTNAPLIERAISELSQGMFRGSYDPSKTVAENLESAMFAGTLMNVVQKIEPTIFQK